MAHNNLVRPPNCWGVGVLGPHEFERFDRAFSAAIDGDAGGTWSPTSYILLGGTHGLWIGITAHLQCDGTSLLYGNVTCGSGSSNTFDVNAAALFHYNVIANHDIYAHGALENDGNCNFGTDANQTVTINCNLHVYQQAYFEQVTAESVVVQHGMTVNGDAVVVGRTTLEGNVDIGTSTTVLNVAANTTFADTSDLTLNGNTAIRGTPTLETALTVGEGGTLVERITLDSGSPSFLGLNLYDGKVFTDGGEVRLLNEGPKGGVLRIVNASSTTLDVKDHASDHLLRTLPARSWLKVERTFGIYGSHGWQSIGEGPYVPLT